jgi:fibronectin-binding autotransporter adhesin
MGVRTRGLFPAIRVHSLAVSFGGLVDPATICAGGSETISKGGTGLGAQISGGIQVVSGVARGATIFAGSQMIRSAGAAVGTTVSNGGTEIVSSGGSTTGTLLRGGQETVLRGGNATGTVISSGGFELVSSGGTAVATHISGGLLEVASGGTAGGVIFSSGGSLQLYSGAHLSGTISGFHLGETIDLRGLAFSSSSSTLSWTQKTSGANASGTLTVKEGTTSTTLTLIGSYTVSNFSATSDGHGGTLVTDPPVVSGKSSVAPNVGPGSSSESFTGAPSGGTTVHSGGYELCGGGALGVLLGRLDSLLSHVTGVISGFDVQDEIGSHSLGFGSSSSAMSRMRATSGGDAEALGQKGGNIFNLALLGQYAANFSPGEDVHSGTFISDAPASSSVTQTPLVAHH